MTRLLSFVLALAFGGYPVGVSGQDAGMRPLPAAPAAPRLELQEIERTYCGGDQLRLGLRLKFTNVGRRPLVLYKLAGRIFQEMVSKSEREAAAGHYKKISHNLPVTYRNFEIPVESTPGELYVVLQPGESHEVTRRVIVFVGTERKAKSHQLKPGVYFYQVKVSTWSDSQALADQLRENWTGIGDFWTSDVTSQPMRLTIDARHSDVPCSK
jgi:hypothetical protein